MLPLWHWLPPERAHRLALWGAKLLYRLRGSPTKPFVTIPPHPIQLWGLTFPHPIGLAAGFDKNGEAIDALAAWGFGFIEVGAVTPKPQPGNPTPRLLRFKKQQAILNRMGFNNQGVDACVAYLQKRRSQTIVGVNLGKQKQTSAEDAVHDYATSFAKVYPYCDFVTINVSSPNTPGLRDLQDAAYLKPLLFELKQEQAQLAKHHQRQVPLLVKVAPDVSDEEIKVMAEVFVAVGIDGLIATNTSMDHTLLGPGKDYGSGGVSGAPLFPKALHVFQQFRQALPDAIPMIACGGIMGPEEVKAYQESGAALMQVYTGLVYKGPRFLEQIVDALR